jgi:hypothetical protein
MGLLYHIRLLYMSEQCVTTYLYKYTSECLNPLSLLEHLILSIIRAYTSRHSGMPGEGGTHYPQKIKRKPPEPD